MKNTMTEKETKLFIEWMNYTDNDSIPFYKTLDDIVKENGEKMTNDLIEEFLEYVR